NVSQGRPISAQAPATLRSRGGTGTSAETPSAATVNAASLAWSKYVSNPISSDAPALHTSTGTSPTRASADAVHNDSSESTASVGIQWIHGRTARSIGEGRRIVAAARRHKSTPFHRLISAHWLPVSTASIAT